MSDALTDKVSDVIRECAQRYILPRYKQLEDHEISSKTGPRDLVTHADLDVEEHMKRVLPELLPGSIVIGEEEASKHPELLDKLKDQDLKIWVVDPVDGTHNFVHHKREFGVMLALVENGSVSQGWIYDILGDEMTVAGCGGGAFSNGNKLKVQSVPEIKKMTGHINPVFFPKQYREKIATGLAAFGGWQPLFCAAHEYLRVARGDAQFAIYSRLKPWDHLAGTLIVTEAGGYCAKWDGNPYVPVDRDVGLIISSDEDTWANVYDAVIRKMDEF